ncbi:MAG: phosphoribosyl-ATP diphosphatase [Gemmataceae bacterium]|nr:phosphoribosyl-ATP diphosphatase [Gemmataceae bacterium]
MTETILCQLMAVIEDRKQNPPEKSYTTTLLRGGVTKVCEKIMEEAGEVVEAASHSATTGKGPVVYEAADLIYHLLVLLAQQDVSLADVEAELARRFGISGITEKESRAAKP